MMFRALSFVIVVLIAAARGASAQPGDLRMVIGTDVVCRAEPDRTSPAAAAPRLGEVFGVVDSRIGLQGQDTWYARAGRRPCWILGSLTTPVAGYASPDTALLALADHALNPATKATFEHLVAADNLLIERRLRRAFWNAPATLPALLDLRHLQIVQAAAGAAIDRRAVSTQPLRLAWMLGHADVVVHFEPGALYHVPTARFWDLYERHRNTADAEQIAWAAATTPVYGDECYTDCLLQIVADTYMRYWRAFPSGSHIAEAVAVAIRRADYAARFCVMVSTGNLTLRPNLGRLIADLRSSLDAVATSGNADLLTLLAEIEQECRAGAVASLEDPRAIRGLVRALGTGFSLVPERLAAFGDRAAPVVLELLARPAADNEVSYQALVALTHMVREKRLSPATLSGVRDAAERWLTTPRGNLLTLVSAIDLAGGLADARLDRILSSLSTDRGEVAARGVTTGIDTVQRRAVAALAGRRQE